jgi:hypothetical protein
MNVKPLIILRDAALVEAMSLLSTMLAFIFLASLSIEDSTIRMNIEMAFGRVFILSAFTLSGCWGRRPLKLRSLHLALVGLGALGIFALKMYLLRGDIIITDLQPMVRYYAFFVAIGGALSLFFMPNQKSDDKSSQQAGAAYPPQGVGSADP